MAKETIEVETNSSEVFPKTIATLNKEKSISMDELVSLTNHNQGKILTALEASYPEGKQLDAIKSLVKSMLWDSTEQVRAWIWEQDRSPDSDNSSRIFPFSPPRQADYQ